MRVKECLPQNCRHLCKKRRKKMGKKIKKFFKDNLQSTVAVILTLISLISAVLAAESHYAKQSYVAFVQYRLDQKITVDQRDDIQNQVWKIEDRYRKEDGTVDENKMPPDMREQYRKLKDNLEEKQKEVDWIKEQNIKQQSR
jgi:hypothetical protein